MPALESRRYVGSAPEASSRGSRPAGDETDGHDLALLPLRISCPSGSGSVMGAPRLLVGRCSSARSSCADRRRPWPQLIDPVQDLGEQRPRHRHLGQLEHQVAAVAHDPGVQYFAWLYYPGFPSYQQLKADFALSQHLRQGSKARSVARISCVAPRRRFFEPAHRGRAAFERFPPNHGRTSPAGLSACIGPILMQGAVAAAAAAHQSDAGSRRTVPATQPPRPAGTPCSDHAARSWHRSSRASRGASSMTSARPARVGPMHA